MQAVSHFVPDERRRGNQTLHAALALFVVPDDRNQHTRGPPVARKFYRCYSRQPNSWIGQLTFDDSVNLFPQGLAQALTMVFGATLLQTAPRNKTNENIRNYCQGNVKGVMRSISISDLISIISINSVQVLP